MKNWTLGIANWLVGWKKRLGSDAESATPWTFPEVFAGLCAGMRRYSEAKIAAAGKARIPFVVSADTSGAVGEIL